ncbi:hypothetical protein [Actinokineospora xionganensis]|uniref:Uncharacterized protein n=1 Tax=Actinokineospora xionganensis TaxID=2684470 RepID=A0ABR7LG96_9PSEU|nr:hypothetical protein [Actinokineospora xionganensis]MBC6451638.1 hypothetical protein [Actinokineospora xionganensis]
MKPSKTSAEAAALVDLCLELLGDPQGLYLRCSDEQRRLLNQALFEVLYIEEHDGELTVTYRLKEPFAELQALHQGAGAALDTAGADEPRTAESTPILAAGGAGTGSLSVPTGWRLVGQGFQ